MCFFMERKITALKVQKNNTSRMNVYLDGSFAFGISRFVGARLSVGQVLNEETIKDLLNEDIQEKAYQKALRYIQYRSRSEQEITKKLQEAEYDEKLISYVIQRLKEHQMAGDLTFARAWVENRTNLRPRSHRMLQMELRQKGVDEEIIDSVLEESPEDDELATALAKKYCSRLVGYDWPDFRKRLFGYLMRKGFDYSVTNDVVQSLWDKMQANGSLGEN